MCAARSPTASSSAATTPSRRISTTARRGTPASAATRPRSLSSRSIPSSTGVRPPPTCATSLRSTAATNLPFGPHRRFLNHASGPVEFRRWRLDRERHRRPCKPVSRSRRSSATTPPATATRAIPCGPTGTRTSPAPSIRARRSSTSTPQRSLPPATGTYGNVSRDSLTGPGLSELDFSATRNAHLTERLGLQFRAEFFNILNHTNLLTPNEVVYTSATSGVSPTAGVVSATSTTSRQIQFGAKLSF